MQHVHIRWRRVLGAALVLLLTTGCGLFPKEEEEAVPVVAPPVKTQKAVYTVKRGNIVEQVSLRARIAAARSEELSYKSAGRLKAVYVRAGEQVKPGQLLAEIHADDAVYQAEQARIRHQKTEIALADARYRLNFNRTPAAENDVRRLELELESARLDLVKWQQQVAESRLYAPFGGQIMAVSARPGDAVQAYQAVITLADPTDLLVEADVDDASLAKLAVGQQVRLEFTDLAGAAPGTLVELPDPQQRATSASTQPRRVKVTLAQGAERARMGMVGKVHVVLQEKQGVLLLPNAAIRRFTNRTYVLMADPRREVDIVVGVEGELETEIVRGLKEGDQVLGR